ncbi:MAG: hypothetical protein LBQ42_09810 [Synergistaceae bacterium]|jgi:hypothetical protein|nr:hypothetical protein [Synergistaceae bacterium]
MKSHKGISLAECLILIVVVMGVMAALFRELEWSAKSYAFAREDLKSQELFFNWVQTFESLWPNVYSDPEDAFQKVAVMLNGTWDDAKKIARVSKLVVEPQALGQSAGRMAIEIKIYSENSPQKLMVNLSRSYNSFSNDTVSDDASL